MNLALSISIYAGGPGSGCTGPNCGRPAGGRVPDVVIEAKDRKGHFEKALNWVKQNYGDLFHHANKIVFRGNYGITHGHYFRGSKTVVVFQQSRTGTIFGNRTFTSGYINALVHELTHGLQESRGDEYGKGENEAYQAGDKAMVRYQTENGLGR